MKELVEYIAKAIVNAPETNRAQPLNFRSPMTTREGLLASKVVSLKPCAPCSE